MFTDSYQIRTLEEILSQHCTVTEALLRDVKSAARLVKVNKGEAIVHQGEICDDFVFNRRGLFRVCNATDDKEDTLLFGTSGDVYTSLHSYYAGEPAIFSLVAEVDSEVWLISFAKMRHLLEKHPEMMRWMNDLLIEQLYSFEKRYLFYNNKSAEERFQNFLKMHNVSLRRTSVRYISSIVSLKHIAQYLGITQSTLSRLRKKLVSGSKA